MAPVLAREYRTRFVLRADHDARRGIVVWPGGANVVKPVLIAFLQSLEDLGMLGGEVVLLARILVQIVKFQLGFASKTFLAEPGWMHKLPRFLVQGEMVVELGHVAAMRLENDLPLGPGRVVSGKQRQEASAIDL